MTIGGWPDPRSSPFAAPTESSEDGRAADIAAAITFINRELDRDDLGEKARTALLSARQTLTPSDD